MRGQCDKKPRPLANSHMRESSWDMITPVPLKTSEDYSPSDILKAIARDPEPNQIPGP